MSSEQDERAKRPSSRLMAGVELGGTTCVVAVVHCEKPLDILERFELQTTTPDDTLPQIVKWLDAREPFDAIGIASFGPVDLDTDSKTYGYITTTPKPGWADTPLLKYFDHYRRGGLCSIGFDTDVNAPAMLEQAHGQHGDDVKSCAYVTVGTGIGVGLVVNGAPLHGLMHPEGGHIMPMRHADDKYQGWCKLHPGSVESLAAARACADRCGVPMNQLASVGDDHEEWDMVAYYLAQLCLSITYIASPHVIVLSGGVMKRTSLFEKIRKQFSTLNGGYVRVHKVVSELENYIVPSKFGNDAGILGACELAFRTLATD